MNNIYKQLVDQNGIENQLAVAIEEYSELIKEITKTLRNKANKMKLIEELADVEIVSEQIMQYFNITRSQILLFKKFKLNRLKEFYLKENEK